MWQFVLQIVRVDRVYLVSCPNVCVPQGGTMCRIIALAWGGCQGDPSVTLSFDLTRETRYDQYSAKLSAISDTGGEDAASIDPGGVLAAGTKPGILTAKTQRAQREKRNHSVL